MNSFSVENVIKGDGINISITGMSIVFAGLLFISVYIWLLPKILDVFTGKDSRKKADQITKKKSPVKITGEEEFDTEANDIASVIGLVLNFEQERLSMTGNEQITITRNTGSKSIWGTAGKMRSMPRRRTHA